LDAPCWGPVEEPADCFNFGDFVRRFGGLAADCPLAYAIRDFFANGGSHALVVRLFRRNAQDDSGRAVLTVGGNLELIAANPGNWGNRLGARVSYGDPQVVKAVAEPLGLAAADFFDLTITDARRQLTEIFRNVSIAPGSGPRRVDRVLEASSNLVRLMGALPGARPAETPAADPPVAAQNGNDRGALEAAHYEGDEAAKTACSRCRRPISSTSSAFRPTPATRDTPAQVWSIAAPYCAKRRAFLLVDPRAAWTENQQTAVAKVRPTWAPRRR
jgi:hypothetical protein